MRVVLLGLDGSGKTQLLYSLKLSQFVTTIPTVGFNVEEINVQNCKMVMWDIGGQNAIRNIWHHYFGSDLDGLIYMVDANDRKRIIQGKNPGEALEEFQKRIVESTKIKEIPVLFLLNKQDLPNAMSKKKFESLTVVKQIFKKLDQSNRIYFCQPTSVPTGKGVLEGMDWLVLQMKLPVEARKKLAKLNQRWKKEKWTFKNHPIFPESIRTAVWGLMLYSEKKEYVCNDVFQYIIQFLPIEFKKPTENELIILLKNMEKY